MFLSLLSSVCLASLADGAAPAWTVTGLDAPESIISDGTGGYVVSNVNGAGDARDGNGYLARIDAAGRLVTREWVSGLDSPKGMARLDGRLFVNDLDHVVEVDLASGEVTGHHPIEGAEFLNDAAAHDGALYLSDSRLGRIYRWRDGASEIWLEDAALAGLNGLLPEADRLLVTTMDDGAVLAIDWAEQTITRLADGLGRLDGIAAAGEGRYIVSAWPGRVWHLNADHSVQLVTDRREDEVYMNDLIIDGDQLLIPHWLPGTVTAWPLDCGSP
ncbi:SMP-30/gluconolactonase/LRE family protein [Maricaulis sp. CAU 1757]